MMNAFIKIVVIGSFSVLSGCMTEATQQRFTAEGSNSVSCRDKVIEARVEIARYKAEEKKNTPTVMFKDEDNAMMYLMVKQMGEMNIAMMQAFTAKGDGLETCDDVIVAMVKADAQKVAGLNSNGKTAIGWIAGLVGLGIISDNWGPEAYGSTGDTHTYNNSRVISDSGNGSSNGSFSSSGEGLGVGNSIATDAALSQGGVEPRQWLIEGDVQTNEAASNSGTNEPIVLPQQDGDLTAMPAE